LAQGILSFRFLQKEGEIRLEQCKFDKQGNARTRTVLKIPESDWGKLKEAFFDHYRLKVKQGWSKK